MRKLLLLASILLMPLSMALSYGSEYVKEVRGDTLVVNDYIDMGSVTNSLYNLIISDTVDVPAGRVYMLRTAGYYPLVNSPSTLRPTIIVGEDDTRLVNNSNASATPPLICGSVYTGGSNTGGLTAGHNLTVKNCNLIPADAAGDLGWSFFGFSASGVQLTIENCLMERTKWVFVNTSSAHSSIFLKDCYFVNLVGQACRRNGGVYDQFSTIDTLSVENCTHINAQGTMYKFREYPIGRVIFNHNTFIDCAGYTFLDLGYQTAVSTTNNIFVNSNFQPYAGLSTMDVGEQDFDMKPLGFVNIHSFPAGDTTYSAYSSLPRRYLFEDNVVYWDPVLNNIDSTLDANAIDGVTNWTDQKIIMNARTDSMFADSATYPHLVLGSVYRVLPNFTNPQNLLTDQLAILKAWVISTMDTNSAAILDDWRLVNTGSDNYIYSDWPIPVDLSYSNSSLVSGGTNGFPVGDLNWFPTQKASWTAQRNSEYRKIDGEIGFTTAVETAPTLPGTYQLSQNYPNPFNPSTVISFTVPRSGNVTLKVFNMLGQEVKTLVNGMTAAGTHEVRFNATGLASGVYFYKISSGDFSLTKKMVLLK